jgi:hypothetical protein
MVRQNIRLLAEQGIQKSKSTLMILPPVLKTGQVLLMTWHAEHTQIVC